MDNTKLFQELEETRQAKLALAEKHASLLILSKQLKAEYLRVSESLAKETQRAENLEKERDQLSNLLKESRLQGKSVPNGDSTEAELRQQIAEMKIQHEETDKKWKQLLRKQQAESASPGLEHHPGVEHVLERLAFQLSDVKVELLLAQKENETMKISLQNCTCGDRERKKLKSTRSLSNKTRSDDSEKEPRDKRFWRNTIQGVESEKNNERSPEPKKASDGTSSPKLDGLVTSEGVPRNEVKRTKTIKGSIRGLKTTLDETFTPRKKDEKKKILEKKEDPDKPSILDPSTFNDPKHTDIAPATPDLSASPRKDLPTTPKGRAANPNAGSLQHLTTLTKPESPKTKRATIETDLPKQTIEDKKSKRQSAETPMESPKKEKPINEKRLANEPEKPIETKKEKATDLAEKTIELPKEKAIEVPKVIETPTEKTPLLSNFEQKVVEVKEPTPTQIDGPEPIIPQETPIAPPVEQLPVDDLDEMFTLLDAAVAQSTRIVNQQQSGDKRIPGWSKTPEKKSETGKEPGVGPGIDTSPTQSGKPQRQGSTGRLVPGRIITPVLPTKKVEFGEQPETEMDKIFNAIFPDEKVEAK